MNSILPDSARILSPGESRIVAIWDSSPSILAFVVKSTGKYVCVAVAVGTFERRRFDARATRVTIKPQD